MDLHQHLANLLYLHDKVEIPGFGYFICEVVDTEIHPVEHRFHPKYKKIDFKVSKDVKGLELIEALTKGGISELQAKADIAKFTRDAIAELKAGKKFQFKNIGFLFVQTGAWVFEQDLRVNYLPESMGLGSFVAKPVQDEKAKVQPATETKTESVKKKRSFPWVPLTAVAVLLIISGAVYWGWNSLQTYWNELGQQDVEVAEVIPADTASQTTTSVMDSLNTLPVDSMATDTVPLEDSTMASEAEIKPQEEVVETKEEVPQEVPVDNGGRLYQNKNYYLVAGCFKDEARADVLVQELRAEGFKASKEGLTKGGLHRVVYGGYDTWALAKADIPMVKEKGREGAWIQSNK